MSLENSDWLFFGLKYGNKSSSFLTGRKRWGTEMEISTHKGIRVVWVGSGPGKRRFFDSIRYWASEHDQKAWLIRVKDSSVSWVLLGERAMLIDWWWYGFLQIPTADRQQFDDKMEMDYRSTTWLDSVFSLNLKLQVASDLVWCLFGFWVWSAMYSVVWSLRQGDLKILIGNSWLPYLA